MQTPAAPVDVPDVLRKILTRKADEVAALRAEVEAGGDSHPIARILASRGSTARSKAFERAIHLPMNTLTVIAEIKRKSPSKGHIGYIANPADLSRTYHAGGAAAISVLTDEEGFGGTMKDLKEVVKQQQRELGNFPGPCPVLRKDFIIDELQIAEAAAAGASAVLLIMAALGKERCRELLNATYDMGLDALVEIHNEEELQMALDIGASVVGVNNRDLRTFDVDLETSLRLAPLIPKEILKVAESGIEESLDAWKLRDAGFNAVLVGEALVKAFEESSSSNTAYVVGYNQAKGLIRAFKAKGSIKYGPTSTASFYGKGEAAKETLGEMSI